MKKNVFYIGILLSAFLLVSCVSLPKKVKEGDTLVMGRFTVNGFGYDEWKEYNISLNGYHTDNITVTIAEWETGKEKIYQIPNDGYFYWTGLKADELYIIKRIEYKVLHNSGAYVNAWVDNVTNMSFTPKEETVVNIGVNHFDFNGTTNWSEWNRDYWGDTKNHFVGLGIETEWLSKDIENQ